MRFGSISEILSVTVPPSVSESFSINIALRLSEAPSFGMPVIYYDKSCKGSQAYTALAVEIVGKERG